jgi:hypothetical protein
MRDEGGDCACSPPCRLCDESDNDACLFRCYRMCGGCSISGDGCNVCLAPKSVILFPPIISTKNRSIQIWCGDCYPTIYLVRWMSPHPMGAPLRRINNYSKTPLPAVPRRGPGAGVLHIKSDFHCSGVNSRSRPFQQSTRNYCYNGHPPFHARRTEKTAMRKHHRNIPWRFIIQRKPLHGSRRVSYRGKCLSDWARCANWGIADSCHRWYRQHTLYHRYHRVSLSLFQYYLSLI